MSSYNIRLPIYMEDQIKNNRADLMLSDETLVDITATAALLDNGKVLAGDKVLQVEIPEDKRVLCVDEGWLATVTIDGKLRLESIDRAVPISSTH